MSLSLRFHLHTIGILTVGLLLTVFNTVARAEVDETRAYKTKVVFEAPPFHGLEPALALTYNSNGGDGIVGRGWTLTAFSCIILPSIHRGALASAGGDIYLLDGIELVPCGTHAQQSPNCRYGGTYTTRIENFFRILKEGTDWEIWNKERTRSTYTPQPLSGGSYRWAVAKVQYTHGNEVHYQYWCDRSDERYPQGIVYGSSGTSRLSTHITFLYERHPAPYTYATGTSLVRVSYRLKIVDVKNAGQQLRAYALTYEPRPDIAGHVNVPIQVCDCSV